MKDFLRTKKLLTTCILAFIALIFIVAMLASITERNYWYIVSTLMASAIPLSILFFLYRFFALMALSFHMDEENIYLVYEKHTVAVAHEKIKQIKCTMFKYKFLLDDGKKLYLTRFHYKPKSFYFVPEDEVSHELKIMYPDKLVY